MQVNDAGAGICTPEMEAFRRSRQIVFKVCPAAVHSDCVGLGREIVRTPETLLPLILKPVPRESAKGAKPV